jgi:ribosome-associated heat shock protein Hsp15
MTAPPDRLRLDKWLWVARFYRTRSLAGQAIEHGRVAVNGLTAKAARELRPGDTVTLRLDGGLQRTVVVRAIAAQRGPATTAQSLYEETALSLAERQRVAEARRLAPDPALAIGEGRPTKRDRRELERTQAQWQRWSASIDDQ